MPWAMKKIERRYVLSRLFEAGSALETPEIEKGLKENETPIPHASLWRILADLKKDGLIRSVPSKRLSKAGRPVRRYEITALGFLGIDGGPVSIKKKETAILQLWLHVYSNSTGSDVNPAFDYETVIRRFEMNPELMMDMVSLIESGLEVAERMVKSLKGMRDGISEAKAKSPPSR